MMGAGNGATQTATSRPEAAVVESIRRFFREDPARMTMMAARRFALTEQAVLEAMIGEWPVVPLRPRVFREVMDGLSRLGTMKVLVRNHAAVIEAVGAFGGYSESGPFFNVQTDSLEMHIQPAEVVTVYSVERAATATIPATYSFQFFDRAGEAAFKVFLWEPGGIVVADRVASFHELTRTLAAESARPEPVFQPPPAPPVLNRTVPPESTATSPAPAPAASQPTIPSAPAPAPAPAPVPLPEGVIPGAATATSKLLGTATTTESTAPPPIPWQVTAIRIGLRVAAAVALLGVLLLLAGLFVTPLFWRHYEQHPRLIDAPKFVQTVANAPDLPLNVALVGNVREVIAAMLDAGWNPADSGTFAEGNRYQRDILLNRPYPKVDLEPRTLFGRPQDLSFSREIPGGERLVVRFWKSDEYSLVGRTFWFGTAWAERAAKSSSEGSGGDSGKPARPRLVPRLDLARDRLIADLSTSLRLTEILRVTGIGPTFSGETSEGSAFYTDGEITIGLIPVGTRRHDRAPSQLASPLLVRLKDSIWSELAPIVAGDEGS